MNPVAPTPVLVFSFGGNPSPQNIDAVDRADATLLHALFGMGLRIGDDPPAEDLADELPDFRRAQGFGIPALALIHATNQCMAANLAQTHAVVINKTIGLRVEKEDEIMGLDTTQHSETAYN